MTNFSMQETQRILVKCKNSLYCNQPYVKEACRQLFWARDEIVNLRRQVTELERKVVESNHRNLDLQYMVDSDALIMEKQKVALKVLGTRSGKRGKALVEERAKRLVADRGDCPYRSPIKNQLIFRCDKGIICDWCQCPIKDEWRDEAREQLRRERKL